MTKSSTTVYTYSHTVGAGDGTATIALSAALDTAGNAVTSAPTSGSTFTVDNTAPSIGSLSLSSQPDTTPNLTFTAESDSSVVITSDNTSGNVGTTTGTGSSQTITLSTLDTGSQTLTATATDAAGNTATDTISVTVIAPSVSSSSSSSSSSSGGGGGGTRYNDAKGISVSAGFGDDSSSTNVDAQIHTSETPDWVKQNFELWKLGVIDDSTFRDGLTYLSKESVLKVSTDSTLIQSGDKIPYGFEYMAHQWYEGKIPESNFLGYLSHLFTNDLWGDA